MDIGLAIESDRHAENLIPAVLRINREMKQYFAQKNYGADLTYIAIGMILMTSTVTSEKLHPILRFKYTKFQRGKSRITGQMYETHTSAEWDIKPDLTESKQIESGRSVRFFM